MTVGNDKSGFTYVGPPLTVAERSCLLRAARERLNQLHEEYDAAATHGDLESSADVLFAEIGCVTAAIAWLWQQPAIDEGGRCR